MDVQRHIGDKIKVARQSFTVTAVQDTGVCIVEAASGQQYKYSHDTGLQRIEKHKPIELTWRK